jgi:hypothetical protein
MQIRVHITTYLEGVISGRGSIVTEKASLESVRAKTQRNLISGKDITLPGSSAGEGEQSVEVDGVASSSP